MSSRATCWRRYTLMVLAGLALLFAGFLVFAHRSAIAEITPPERAAFAPADIRRGAALALIPVRWTWMC